MIKALKYFLNTIFVIVVLIAVLLLVPRAFSMTPFVVLSGSMAPTMPTGSLAFVKAEDSYNVGEIIAFQLGNDTTVTHRIYAITDDGFMTKGDANDEPDMNTVSDGQCPGSGKSGVQKLRRCG